MERGGEISDAERVRRRPKRFFPAQNINVGLRKKLIDVEKIWTTEHVERDRNVFLRFSKILRFPSMQFHELPRVQFRKRLLEICGMLDPGRIAGERSER